MNFFDVKIFVFEAISTWASFKFFFKICYFPLFSKWATDILVHKVNLGYFPLLIFWYIQNTCVEVLHFI